jgi:hypothetical protein
MGIQECVPVVYAAEGSLGAAEIEQRLREGSLACVNMSQQTNAARHFFQLFRHSAGLLSWIISSIIPWAMDFVDRFY